MHRLSCALWLVGVGLGCTEGQSPHADASAPDASARADAADGGLDALLSQWIDEWDRQMTTQCSCLVESGAYESRDECFEYLRSGSDWLECLSSALAERESPETVATGRCVLDQIRMRNECLESTACGTEAHAQCSVLMLECAAVDPALTVIISESCPDTTILPRNE